MIAPTVINVSSKDNVTLAGFPKRCSTCRKCDCRKICSYYRSDMCRNTTRAPYVCNGCNQVYECHKVHFFYRANAAYDAYISKLGISWEGICLSGQQLYEPDCLITPMYPFQLHLYLYFRI